MTADQLITDVRMRIRDTKKAGDSDAELLNYINEAIDFLNAELIALKDPTMIKQLSVSGGDTVVPTNFVHFVAQYPVFIVGGVVKPYDDTETVVCNYYAANPHISQVYHTLPFSDFWSSMFVELVSVLALNRNEFDTTQDERRIQSLRQIVRAAKGAAS